MSLRKVVFLAAYTSRSQAYAQALVARALVPSRVVTFGPAPKEVPGPATACPEDRSTGSLAWPNLSESLGATIERAGWNRRTVSAADVNAPEVIEALRAESPELVIYSGYGGQILREGVLSVGAPFLHVHSGWLPDYRGSTTLYYSLLREGRCAASALVLDRDIDTGPLVARKHYPAPASAQEVDHGYDGAIRADLMAEVVAHYEAHGVLPSAGEQDPAQGSAYYVIHPVLKHLALRSLDEEVVAA